MEEDMDAEVLIDEGSGRVMGLGVRLEKGA